ncbi:hypothetical protein ODZ84_16135 [Chryseobacterium fluminis]|uniref:hypothetical protein n=1 Tax=Chryseobacterium fluminis TaxID=2983606 RepID=UPI00225A5206|nr:hypothetical protein [Chryseobacterium sp. MMS21-Ot14]UZT96740.1 hypothetical protein ODZ84_16135 [Chryseobacterium sp. MMS21-Ot14]
MSFYSKFSEDDLIESYRNQTDYQGKPSHELLEEISKRGSLDDFIRKIDHQKSVLDERNRIIREIHRHYLNKSSKQEVAALLHSEILSTKEIDSLVEKKYADIHFVTENLKVDAETIIRSLIGSLIASLASTIIMLSLILLVNSLIVFQFFLLVPAYIINYLIIKFLTNKTRDNLAVFIATFIATVLNVLYLFLLLSAYNH